jgi:hypothetical protein
MEICMEETNGNIASRFDRIERILEAVVTRQSVAEDEYARLLKAQVVIVDSQATMAKSIITIANSLETLAHRVTGIGDKLDGLIGVVDGFIRAKGHEN